MRLPAASWLTMIQQWPWLCYVQRLGASGSRSDPRGPFMLQRWVEVNPGIAWIWGPVGPPKPLWTGSWFVRQLTTMGDPAMS